MHLKESTISHPQDTNSLWNKAAACTYHSLGPPAYYSTSPPRLGRNQSYRSISCPLRRWPSARGAPGWPPSPILPYWWGTCQLWTDWGFLCSAPLRRCPRCGPAWCDRSPSLASCPPGSASGGLWSGTEGFGKGRRWSLRQQRRARGMAILSCSLLLGAWTRLWLGTPRCYRLSPSGDCLA